MTLLPVPDLFWIILPLFVVGIIVLGVYSAQQAKKRREALGKVAERYGLSFDPDKHRPRGKAYDLFDLFDEGHSNTRYNTMQGHVEVGGRRLYLRAGDYLFKRTSSNGKSSSTKTYHHSYALIELPQDTPDIQLRPEGLFDRMAAAVGFNDLDFESVEFSDAFHVKSSDERFAYDLFHPKTMELLLREKPPSMQISRGYLLLHRTWVWKPEEFGPQLEFVRQFVEQWPRHLLAA